MNTWTNLIQNYKWPEFLEIPEIGGGVACAEKMVELYFKELKKDLSNTPQDPTYHGEGDVWTHTLMVVDELTKSTVYQNLSFNEKAIVFYAALLHDISKPETTKEVDGKWIAPGHSQKGAIRVRVLLWELEVPWFLREQISRLIEVHQLPFFAFNSKKGLKVDYLIRKISLDRSIKLLSLLAEADIRGRICPDQSKILDEIELFSELSKELNCWEQPYLFPNNETKMAYLLSGGERYPDESIYLEESFEVILLSGIPASGKSTWRKKNNSIPCISYDDIRQELKLKHGEGTGTIVHLAVDRMKDLLRKRKTFVVDATHLSEQMREKTIKLIQNYHGKIKIIAFESSKKEILFRNQKRNSTLTNQKIEKMLQNWEFPSHCEAETIEVLKS